MLPHNTVGVGLNTWSNLNLLVKNCAAVNKEYANFFCMEHIYQASPKYKLATKIMMEVCIQLNKLLLHNTVEVVSNIQSDLNVLVKNELV